mgnify:CR=1 FL=1
MTYKYLTREYETITDIKKHFRELAKMYHSDYGGTDEQFRELYSEYEYLIEHFIEKQYKDVRMSEMVKALINELMFYEDMELEVVGDWLWVDTSRNNDKLLKDLGFFWSSKHSKYYYSGKTKKVTKCSSYSMQDMRNMMGNKKIAKKEKEERLAIR